MIWWLLVKSTLTRDCGQCSVDYRLEDCFSVWLCLFFSLSLFLRVFLLFHPHPPVLCFYCVGWVHLSTGSHALHRTWNQLASRWSCHPAARTYWTLPPPLSPQPAPPSPAALPTCWGQTTWLMTPATSPQKLAMFIRILLLFSLTSRAWVLILCRWIVRSHWRSVACFVRGELWKRVTRLFLFCFVTLMVSKWS